jgi:hypothetical protein
VIGGAGYLRFVSVALLAGILVVTGLLAVPLHRRLSADFDGVAYRSLLRVDLIRAVLATVNTVVAAVLLH